MLVVTLLDAFGLDIGTSPAATNCIKPQIPPDPQSILLFTESLQRPWVEDYVTRENAENSVSADGNNSGSHCDECSGGQIHGNMERIP